MNAKLVIVNADDYGLTPSVSSGIREAHLEGILTSTTVLVSGESVEPDLEILKKECPDIGIGIHLALTSFMPTLNPMLIPSLVTQDGIFYDLNSLENRKQNLSEIELYQEWKAQILRLQSYGIQPDHLDSHHYVCYLSEVSIKVMCALAKEFNLPVRTPVSPFGNHSMETLGKRMIQSHDIPSPENFFGDFTSKKGTAEVLHEILERIPVGATEVLSHAGRVDSQLRKVSSLVESREAELESLKLPSTRAIVENLGLRLSTFGSIFRAT